jgi:hypothetical protein
MEFKEIATAVQQLTDEEIATLQGQAAKEYRRRLSTSFEARRVPGPIRVVIDLAFLANSIRESIRQEMVFSSDAVLLAVLEQLENQMVLTEEDLIAILRTCLTLAYAYEARCEMQKRVESVK